MPAKRKRPAPTEPDASPAYAVGYGKPPKHARFKPGQSGNPKGRPRGQRNLRTVVQDALKERITIREGDRTRKASKLDAIARVIITHALRGDQKGVAALIQLMRAAGLLSEEPAAPAPDTFSTDDEALIVQFLDRLSMPVPGRVDPSDASAEIRASPASPDEPPAAPEGAS